MAARVCLLKRLRRLATTGMPGPLWKRCCGNIVSRCEPMNQHMHAVASWKEKKREQHRLSMKEYYRRELLAFDPCRYECACGFGMSTAPDVCLLTRRGAGWTNSWKRTKLSGLSAYLSFSNTFALHLQCRLKPLPEVGTLLLVRWMLQHTVCDCAASGCLESDRYVGGSQGAPPLSINRTMPSWWVEALQGSPR